MCCHILTGVPPLGAITVWPDTDVYGTILCCCKLTGYTAHPITVQLSPKDSEKSTGT